MSTEPNDRELKKRRAQRLLRTATASILAATAAATGVTAVYAASHSQSNQSHASNTAVLPSASGNQASGSQSSGGSTNLLPQDDDSPTLTQPSQQAQPDATTRAS